jgi:hypothetical protein
MVKWSRDIVPLSRIIIMQPSTLSPDTQMWNEGFFHFEYTSRFLGIIDDVAIQVLPSKVTGNLSKRYKAEQSSKMQSETILRYHAEPRLRWPSWFPFVRFLQSRDHARNLKRLRLFIAYMKQSSKR